jgi:UDP-4-amino-4,6-dideoxy-N-acetyl-beta-L-altrosamine transaminase
MEKPAIEGGIPSRESFLPYAKHWLGKEEKKEILEVLNSEWVTTGPKVTQFENEIAQFSQAKYAVAVNSGTAALHCCTSAIDIKGGDEVITSTFTFLASANCVVYRNGTPVLCDIQEDTYNIDPNKIREKITAKTKAIIPVHYSGQPCDMDEINRIAKEHNLVVIEDAAHAFGAQYRSKKIGSLSDFTVFSFHPAKNITTGEGGAVLTNNDEFFKLLKIHRTHGITSEAAERFGKEKDWYYEMIRLGYRYNMPEASAAMGIAQLRKLDKFQSRRQRYASIYSKALKKIPEIITPHIRPDRTTSWHLYTIRIRQETLKIDRDQFIKAMRAENIGVNVHYIPVHLHPYYQKNYGYKNGDFPVAEKVFDTIITLPLFPKMKKDDVKDVINAVKKIVEYYRR